MSAATKIYTLSLHDALPIYSQIVEAVVAVNDARKVEMAKKIEAAFGGVEGKTVAVLGLTFKDRKSTRLNSSHMSISYAVFCLKKKRIHAVCTPTILTTITCN